MEVSMHLTNPADNEMLGIPLKKRKRNLYAEACALDSQKKWDEAIPLYEELLTEHFGNTAVLASWGMNCAHRGKGGLANALLTAALDRFASLKDDTAALGIELKGDIERFLRTKKSELMNAIGTTWKAENNTEKARYWFERARETVGEPCADITNNLATLYINEGKPEKALVLLDEAISVNPEHAQARWNRALTYLETGDYEQGFSEYHWGQRAEVRGERNYAAGTEQLPVWDGSPGRRVVVYGEQGIGDEIMFASVIPDLVAQSALVVFDCHKKLHRLFCNSFGQLDIYGTREDMGITWPVMPDGKPRYGFDARIAIGDLPRYFRRKLEDFPGKPYLKPTTEAELRWAQRLNEKFTDGKPVIGINWIGGHKKTRVEVRSMKLEQWLPILRQDAHFVSLQYTECADELFEFENTHGIKIHHWDEAARHDHYDETAGLVANLDLVISCCSSVIHLGGAMGVPTWCMVPSRPAWRYRLDLPTMPWYGKTVTLFRQAPDTTVWEPVVSEVAENLAELIGATKHA